MTSVPLSCALHLSLNLRFTSFSPLSVRVSGGGIHILNCRIFSSFAKLNNWITCVITDTTSAYNKIYPGVQNIFREYGDDVLRLAGCGTDRILRLQSMRGLFRWWTPSSLCFCCFCGAGTIRLIIRQSVLSICLVFPSFIWGCGMAGRCLRQNRFTSVAG